MKWLTYFFILMSILMMIGGVTLDILVWFHKIAKTEPPLVLHLSTAALYFSGFGNIITAMVNKQVRPD